MILHFNSCRKIFSNFCVVLSDYEGEERVRFVVHTINDFQWGKNCIAINEKLGLFVFPSHKIIV
jgi:hypothetical protein